MGLRPTPEMLDYETARRHGHLLRGPYHVAMDITNQCNMRCKHCFNLSGTLERDELNDSEVLALVDELREMQPHSFCFCGGEPLLRLDLVLEVTRRLTSNHIVVSMVSNGWLMTEQRARALRNAGVTQVQISIDGADAAAHESLRNVNGSWDRACQAVRILTDAGFPLRPITCCPTRFNAHQIEQMIDLAQSLGGTELRVQPLMLLGRAVQYREELLPSDSQYRTIARTLLSRQGTVPLSLEWGDPVDHIIRFSQLLPDICPYLDIRSDGRIGVSAYLPLTVGDLRCHSLHEYWQAGLAQVWQAPIVQRLAKYIRNMDDFYQPGGYLPVVFYERHLHTDLIDDDLLHMTPDQVDQILVDTHRRAPWLKESAATGGEGMVRSVLARPQFRWSAVTYNREEKSGHLTVLPALAPDMGNFVINPAARRLIELCDGTRSFSQLYAEFAAGFDGATPETVKTDVDEVLRSLDELGFITWLGGNSPLGPRADEERFTDAEAGVSVVLATERHARQVGDYVADVLSQPNGLQRLVWISPISFVKENYTELALRNSMFNYLEFFCLIMAGEKVRGLCIVSSSSLRSGSRSAHLSLLAVDRSLDIPATARLLKAALARINDYVITTNLKVRAYVTENQWHSTDFKPLFIGLGLEEEYVLRDEMGVGQHIIMLSCHIPMLSKAPEQREEVIACDPV